MFCIYCGKEIGESDTFCAFCGKETAPGKEGEPSAEEKTMPTPPTGQQVPAPIGEASTDSDTEPAGEPPAGIGSIPPADGQVAPATKKLRGFAIFVIAACVLIAALLAVGGFLAWQMLQGSGGAPAPAAATGNIEVPALEGLGQDEAEAAIEQAGLSVGAVSIEPNETVAAGAVVKQTPAAGTRAGEGSVVHLIVSKGPATVVKHEYEIVPSMMTWDEAKVYCEQQGGYLACITSQEEYDTVLALAKDSGRKVFWLGGHRDSAGNFAWVSGEPFAFSAWGPGEPNNDGGAERCLALFDAQGAWAWYDTPSTFAGVYKADRVAFVLEREVEQPAA